jgi:hypothetical protein
MVHTQVDINTNIEINSLKDLPKLKILIKCDNFIDKHRLPNFKIRYKMYISLFIGKFKLAI